MTLLEQCMREVVNPGPEECLPRNLSDRWLDIVAASVDELLSCEANALEGKEADAAKPGAIALAVLLRLLEHRAGTRAPFFVTYQDLARHLESYRIELALEEVHRCTDVRYEPATLENILTDRPIKTWRP